MEPQTFLTVFNLSLSDVFNHYLLCEGMIKKNISLFFKTDFFSAINATASALYDDVRILCWVMTSPKTLYTRAIEVNATWAGHCNKVVFMSSESDPVSFFHDDVKIFLQILYDVISSVVQNW